MYITTSNITTFNATYCTNDTEKMMHIYFKILNGIAMEFRNGGGSVISMATMHGFPYGPGTLRNQVDQGGVKSVHHLHSVEC